MDFAEYKKLVDKYYEKDCREVNFQNRIIIPFLESFIPKEFDVVDSSTLYKNWRHYKDEKGNGICRETFAGDCTPDILIMKGWSLFAIKRETPSIIIEVKRPTASDRSHADKEVKNYVQDIKCKFVILTDGITWEIYEGGNEKQPQYFRLSKSNDTVCNRRDTTSRKVQWIDEDIENNDWERLLNKIRSYLQQQK